MVNFFKAHPDITKRAHGMKRMSDKRRALNAKRLVFVRAQLAKRPLCEAGERIAAHLGAWALCLLDATELHEPLSRKRKPGPETILDEANSVAICRACHGWVHGHPSEAEAIGLLRSSRGK